MSVYYEDATVRVLGGDCLDILRELPDNSVDSVVTDPPYALGFMGREWDTFGMDVGRGAQARKQRAAEVTPTGVSHATSAGPYLASGVDSLRAAGAPFQRWCEAWARECLRVLKPGGHLLAFGGTRTSHRLACAVEDAGFEIRDSIAWLYGSGFPKSLDVSKAIDRQRHDGAEKLQVTTWLADMAERNGVTRADVDARMGTSDMAGWWLSRLARRCAVPTLEQVPNLLAAIGVETDDVPDEIRSLLIDLNGMKGQPGPAWWRREVTAERFRAATGRAEQGSGGYAFGEGFAETAPATDDARTWQGWGTALKPAHEPIVVARKPLTGTVAANVLTHGTGALNVDGCRVGDGSDSQGARPEGEASSASRYTDHGAVNLAATPGPRGGSPSGRWPANVVLDESQAEALDAQSGTLTTHAGTAQSVHVAGVYGPNTQPGRVLSEGDQGGASRFFYVAKADASERVRVAGVAHPTVKPLALMRWLVRLVTPPGGTVLEPFAGSGTTVEACILEGFRCIAIEREADYLPLIMQRINRRRDPVAAVQQDEDRGLFDLLDGEPA